MTDLKLRTSKATADYNVWDGKKFMKNGVVFTPAPLAA